MLNVFLVSVSSYSVLSWEQMKVDSRPVRVMTYNLLVLTTGWFYRCIGKVYCCRLSWLWRCKGLTLYSCLWTGQQRALSIRHNRSLHSWNGRSGIFFVWYRRRYQSFLHQIIVRCGLIHAISNSMEKGSEIPDACSSDTEKCHLPRSFAVVATSNCCPQDLEIVLDCPLVWAWWKSWCIRFIFLPWWQLRMLPLFSVF